MKISMIFMRKGARRRRPAEAIERMTNWTTRDWADLPVHRPRTD